MHWDFQNVHFLIARMSSGHFLKRCISPSKCTSHEFCHMYILSHSHTCAAVTTCLSQSYTCVQHHPQHAYISAAILLKLLLLLLLLNMVGCRQKRARLEARSSVPVAHSNLAGLLALMCVNGEINPVVSNRLALAAIADIDMALQGNDVKSDLGKFAKLGSHGRNTNLCRKQLYENLLAKPELSPHPFDVPLKDIGTIGKTRNFVQDMLLPHLAFGQMWNHYRDWFCTNFFRGPAVLESFWSAVDGHPLLSGNPIRMIPNYASTTIPFSMNGDGVVTVGCRKSWQKAMNAISFGSLVQTGSTVATHLLSWVWFTAIATGAIAGVCRSSSDTFWNIMKWSLQALFDGVHPTHDWNGVLLDPDSPLGKLAGNKIAALPDGSFLRGMLFTFKTDLDSQGKDLKMGHISATEGCAHCPATKSLHTRPWYKFNRALAAWLGSVFTNVTWRLQRGHYGVAIFHLLFTSSLTLGCDTMHIKHLGSDRYLYGSVLWLLIYEMLDDSAELNCEYIWELVSAFYKTNEYSTRNYSTYRILKLRSFTDPTAPRSSYPMLKGKAAMIKHIGPALLEIWAEHYSGAAYDADCLLRYEQILAALRACVRMDVIVADNRDWALPADVSTEYEDLAFLYAGLVCRLGNHYETLNYRLFDTTIKLHYLVHAALMAKHLHPRLSWCYQAEHFMLYVRTLCKSCIPGSSMPFVHNKMVRQHCQGKHTDMAERCRWFRD